MPACRRHGKRKPLDRVRADDQQRLNSQINANPSESSKFWEKLREFLFEQRSAVLSGFGHACLSSHGVTYLTADGDRGRDHRLGRLFDTGAKEAEYATGRVGLQTVEARQRVIQIFRGHAAIGGA